MIALYVGTAVVSVWWSVRYQRRVISMIRSPRAYETPLAPVVATAQPVTPIESNREVQTVVLLAERDHHAAPCSVLGWDGFRVVSTLVLDGSVLIGCRSLSTTGADQAFDDDDQTIVLLIGDDPRAEAAVELLSRWRSRRTVLRLRPIDRPGAIELIDERHNALRAALLAA
jgi:hypothetical protein